MTRAGDDWRESRHTDASMKPFSTEDLLACYRRGVFPMAESREDDGFFIVDPEWRCIFPLDRLVMPRTGSMGS